MVNATKADVTKNNATKANAKKTKKELLEELESIKGILLQEEGPSVLHLEPQPIEEEKKEPTTVLEEELAKRLKEVAEKQEMPLPQRKPLVTPKANGENPFLPRHIRERLKGNNIIPSYELEAAQKIISATKSSSYSLNSDVVVNNFSAIHKNFLTKPREHLVEDVVKSLKPQIEAELRQRLATMPVEALEELLSDGGE
jgi:hypothetical protein